MKHERYIISPIDKIHTLSLCMLYVNYLLTFAYVKKYLVKSNNLRFSSNIVIPKNCVSHLIL